MQLVFAGEKASLASEASAGLPAKQGIASNSRVRKQVW